MMGWIFLLGAVVVAGAGLAARRHMAGLRRARLSDDAIRQIEARGRIEVEEPLDLEEAAEEEERFWGESWDEPERW